MMMAFVIVIKTDAYIIHPLQRVLVSERRDDIKIQID